MADVTIAELVRNGTMNAEMAAVLWAAVDEQVSFLTVALPRLAGKSTTSNAALSLRRPDVPLHRIAGEPAEMARLQQERLGGYLVVEEFSRAPMWSYIWGPPVHRVFETLPFGYSLQTCLHADSVEAGMLEVTQGNGISDEQASAFKLVLYIERFGTDMSNFVRRLVDVYEVHKVENGRPVGHSLFRWHADGDRFEKIMDPHQWGQDRQDMARRVELIETLASSGRTTTTDVAVAVAGYRDGRQVSV